ncbi:hypothetical protein GCM10023321_49360 [Pseudonocardia eucalypti]|uniref:Uncharacterized protein n=1 Tax=Pseudonocardia eucalypti TaxID=648755 RepID=A0ABP9QJS9_9PSEU|nr:hypothetical protein [Pseudonocardia eucalypti]
MRLIGYAGDGVRRIGRLDGDVVTPIATTEDFYDGPYAALDSRAVPESARPLSELVAVRAGGSPRVLRGYQLSRTW